MAQFYGAPGTAALGNIWGHFGLLEVEQMATELSLTTDLPAVNYALTDAELAKLSLAPLPKTEQNKEAETAKIKTKEREDPKQGEKKGMEREPTATQKPEASDKQTTLDTPSTLPPKNTDVWAQFAQNSVVLPKPTKDAAKEPEKKSAEAETPPAKSQPVEKTKESEGLGHKSETESEAERDETALSNKAFQGAFDKRINASSYGLSSSPHAYKVAKADDNDNSGGAGTPKTSTDIAQDETPGAAAFKTAFDKRVGAESFGLTPDAPGATSSQSSSTTASETEVDLSLSRDAFKKAWNKKFSLDEEGKIVDRTEDSNFNGLSEGYLGIDKDSFAKAFDKEYGFSNNSTEDSSDNEMLGTEAFGRAFDDKLSKDNPELFDYLEDPYSDWYFSPEDYDSALSLFDDSSLDFEDWLGFDTWQPDFLGDYYDYEMAYLAQTKEENERRQELEEQRNPLNEITGINPDSIKDEATRVAYESREKQLLSQAYGVGVIGRERLETEYDNPILEGYKRSDLKEKV